MIAPPNEAGAGFGPRARSSLPRRQNRNGRSRFRFVLLLHGIGTLVGLLLAARSTHRRFKPQETKGPVEGRKGSQEGWIQPSINPSNLYALKESICSERSSSIVRSTNYFVGRTFQLHISFHPRNELNKEQALPPQKRTTNSATVDFRNVINTVLSISY